MNARMKKLAAAILAAVLLLLTGCAGQNDTSASRGTASEEAAASSPDAATAAPAAGNLDPDNPVTVTLWYYYTGENQSKLEAAVEEFNRTVGSEHGVLVETAAKGNLQELEAAVTDSAKGVINSEEMPNIFSCYSDKALELDELGAMCDMSDYFTAEEQEEYVQGFLEEGILNGKLLVLPIVKSTELLYINENALNEFTQANPGAMKEDSLGTWEGLYDLSGAYYTWTDQKTETPWDGKGFMGIDELANFLIVSNKQLGVDLMDGDTASVNLDSTVLKKIFTLYYEAVSLGYFDEVGKFRSDDVKTGDLAAYVGASSGASYFPMFIEVDNQQVDISLEAGSYPVFKDAEPYAIQQGAGMAVAKADAALEEGSCLFLKWFTDVQENVNFAAMSGYLPVKKEAYADAEVDQTLDALTDDSPDADNIRKVYDIAFEEVVQADPYAAKPFNGSYDVRSMMKSTLADAGLAGREKAAPLKAEGKTADEILTALDVDAAFTSWLNEVRTQLDDLGVTYNES